MNPRANADLAVQYWNDSTLKAWFWHANSWCPSEWTPSFSPDVHWHVGHERPTEPPVKMCELGGIRFPMPMTEAPGEGEMYIYVSTCGVYQEEWLNTAWDKERLERGLCHRTEEAAQQHYRALVAANMQAVEAVTLAAAEIGGAMG